MQLTVSDAEQIGAGVWTATVDPTELMFLGGRPAEGGSRSVVVVTGARYEQGLLHIQPGNSMLVNRGGGVEVVFVDRNAGGETGETSSPSSVRRSGVRESSLSEMPSKQLAPGASYFWVTVGKGLQENYEQALISGVWGVEAKYRNRIESVRQGDFIVFYGKEVGFALVPVLSPVFEDRSRVWSDAVYPYRVRIGTPVKRDHAKALSDVYHALLDPSGRPYDTVNAAGRAIGGAAGVFRPLTERELSVLFGTLEWVLESEQEV